MVTSKDIVSFPPIQQQALYPAFTLHSSRVFEGYFSP